MFKNFYIQKLITLSSFTLLSFSQPYIADWPEKLSSKLLIRDWVCQQDFLSSGCPSDYLNSVFSPLIPKDQVRVILEIGSRDGIDALCLSEHFKAHIYSFECNPEALEICKYNIGSNPNITLIPFAAWNRTTPLSFFPIVAAGEEPLIGLSSIFKLDPKGPVQDTQKQREITVQAVRLDEWMEKEKIDQVDLICIDVQGGTLQVLEGLGKSLTNVKYIIAEVEYQQYYLGQVLYPEVETYLSSYGFTPIAQMFHNGIYKDVADTLFIRNELIPINVKQKNTPIVGFYR